MTEFLGRVPRRIGRLIVCATAYLAVGCQTSSGSSPVTPGPVPPITVTVAPGTASVRVADTLRLHASIQNYSGAAQFRWRSLNPQIAAVSDSGVVTGLTEGT